ncbi:MAG: helix-turn-helix domain-containing protein [Synergistaceae bacterium]|jgi:hypothetical protein|nr:helix-turn-helix domain-containing protein [Synergistaceae bacterium]
MTVRSRIEKSIPSIAWGGLPLLLGEKDAALILGTSLSFLRKARSEGARGGRTIAPPFVAVGGRRYYRTADLKSWVEGLAGREAI